MTEIKKVAVIGSGVMGAAIAAHIANGGTPVILFDIVPDGAESRSELAENAIKRLLKTNPPPLTHKKKAKLITPANLEDDLELLGGVDWIVEAIVERLDIKQSLYKTIDEHRKKGSFVSSNTSTIPLQALTNGFSDSFKHDFLITHFFNPPRYMRLMELVTVENTRKDAPEIIGKFCDITLGKEIVNCKDTAGFIANRIGCFWLEAALVEAFKCGISVEDADAVMGKPMGVPKTGVFGLMDLIGIDLLPLIASAFKETLPKDDEFIKIYEEPELVKKMIADGYTGRKGKGGFYKLNEKRVKEAIDLTTGEYNIAKPSALESVKVAREGLRSLVTHDDIGGRYSWSVLKQTLSYAASLVPEISDDIRSVDEAMKQGYNWKYGPFELIDRFGSKDVSGAKWFADKLIEEGHDVPELLVKAGNNPFYAIKEEKRQYLTTKGTYQTIVVDKDAWTLSDIKSKPVAKNPSASLWDVGDDIACLEFTSKMNSLDPTSLDMIMKSIEIVKKDFNGLIIGNDGDNFCVGANIGVLLFAANIASWKVIDGIIKQGQDTYMALKYAPFPVVAAPAGMALGGGCEILLHSDAVQAHIETYTGLVEVGVGVIPGWGGCKEMLFRSLSARAESDGLVAKAGGMFSGISSVKTLNTIPAIEPVFMNISTARVSKSAEEARDMFVLNKKSRITMNRRRLLADAKNLCLELSENYTPPEKATISLPGKTARTALNMAIKSFAKAGKALPHDVVVSTALGGILSGGNTDITKELTEQDILDLEQEAFAELIRNPNTLARIEHMLEKGKPLRN